MRPVDADAFKKVLSEHEMQHNKRRNFDEYSYGAASAYEHAGDLLDEMPTVERPQWIPCSERLPRFNEYVLVYRPEMAIKIIVDCYDEGWTYSKDDAVVAWMPLPEPPKGVIKC